MPETIAAGGAITFATFTERRWEIEKAIEQSGGIAVVLDMDGEYSVTSVLVVAMLAWMRCAHRADKTIEFVNVPDRLADVIAFSGLSETMGIAETAPLQPR